MSFTIDTSDVRRFAIDLGKAPVSALQGIDDVLHDAAWEMTEVAKNEARGTRWSRVGRSWTYEPAYGVGEVAYDVGPDRDKDRAAGLLGAYFGWPNGGGGSLSLDVVVDRVDRPIMKSLGKALDDALGAS